MGRVKERLMRDSEVERNVFSFPLMENAIIWLWAINMPFVYWRNIMFAEINLSAFSAVTSAVSLTATEKLLLRNRTKWQCK